MAAGKLGLQYAFSSNKHLQEGLIDFSPNMHFQSFLVPSVWFVRDLCFSPMNQTCPYVCACWTTVFGLSREQNKFVILHMSSLYLHDMQVSPQSLRAAYKRFRVQQMSCEEFFPLYQGISFFRHQRVPVICTLSSVQLCSLLRCKKKKKNKKLDTYPKIERSSID